MRKRLAIVGIAEEGLALIPLLEANPDIEVCAVLSDDREAALEGLRGVDPALPERFAALISDDANTVLRTPGLTAVIDADPGPSLRNVLREAPERGIQVSTPLIAKLLYAFGPIDASRKPDLLQTLGEILESYNLTVDRRGLLNRILQIAVGATGADRGSLMLLDPTDNCLSVDVAIGIETELIPKIRIRPGEGIAGRALEDRRAILLKGKADRKNYNIFRERDDVESAISAPLIHEGRAIGVLNLSHARQRGAFTEEDRDFVSQLARIDAKIIARAEEYHTLLRDSARLHAQTDVRRILADPEPLPRRLTRICEHFADQLNGGICHLFLYDRELQVLILQASSSPLDPLAIPIRLRLGEGIHGWVASSREPALLSRHVGNEQLFFAVLPLVTKGQLQGLLSFEGVNASLDREILTEKITAFAESVGQELYDAIREQRQEREATQTAAIHEFAARLRDCKDSAELHRMTTTSAAMILESEHAILRLQEADTGRFQIRSYFGSADTESQSPLFTLEKELSIEAIKQGGTHRVVDLETRGDLDIAETDVRTALVRPLTRSGRVVGTLSLLGKVVRHPLAGESFSAEDESILERFAEHVVHAIERVQERERTRHRQRFDELTGLPNAPHLRERLEQEIARCSAMRRGLVLIRLQIQGLSDLLSEQQEDEGERLVMSIAQELRGGVREFDVLARSAPDTFDALIPEPETEIPGLLGPLARRAREAIRREPDATLAERLRLRFGYAVFPEEGQTVKALLEKAREPRITSD